MGFFDKEVQGSFDRLFDYNRDGVLDVNEQGFQLQYIVDSIEEDDRRRNEDSDFSSSFDYDDDDIDEDDFDMDDIDRDFDGDFDSDF